MGGARMNRWRGFIHFFVTSVLFVYLGSAKAGVSPDRLAEQWNEVLSEHIAADGAVDFLSLRKQPNKLRYFLEDHADIDGRTWTPATRKSVLINFYNGMALWNIMRFAMQHGTEVDGPEFLKFPLTKMTIPGGNIWNGSYRVKFAGEWVTSDDVSHGLLRGKTFVPATLHPFRQEAIDPRIHGALSCAAWSCPPLLKNAYTEENIETLLNTAMTRLVSDNQQFSKASESSMRANDMIVRYYKDFEANPGLLQVGEYLAQFLSADAREREWKSNHFRNNLNDRSKIGLQLSRSFLFFANWLPRDTRVKIEPSS